MELIDKAALIAEIENWKQHTLKCGYAGQGEYEEGNKQGRLDTCEKILSSLDTLEVKEVDLEKKINKYISDNFFGSETIGFFANRTKEEPNDQDIALCAKHFFELGLKAQKGE